MKVEFVYTGTNAPPDCDDLLLAESKGHLWTVEHGADSESELRGSLIASYDGLEVSQWYMLDYFIDHFKLQPELGKDGQEVKIPTEIEVPVLTAQGEERIQFQVEQYEAVNLLINTLVEMITKVQGRDGVWIRVS